VAPHAVTPICVTATMARRFGSAQTDYFDLDAPLACRWRAARLGDGRGRRAGA